MPLTRTPTKNSMDNSEQDSEGLIGTQTTETNVSAETAPIQTSSLAEGQFLDLMRSIGALHEVVTDIANEANSNRIEIVKLKEQLKNAGSTVNNKEMQVPIPHVSTRSDIININDMATFPSVSNAMSSNMNTVSWTTSATIPQGNSSQSTAQPYTNYARQAAIAQPYTNYAQQTTTASEAVGQSYVVPTNIIVVEHM